MPSDREYELVFIVAPTATDEDVEALQTQVAELAKEFGGTVENLMHEIHMFDRSGPLNMDGFKGSGADWLDVLSQYIDDGKTIIASPHKVYGPESNDLALQLRKRGKSKVILGGMSANLCVEAHMRELVEQGFEVACVSDARAAAALPGGDFYQAAMLNFRMIASSVQTTDEIVGQLKNL